MFLQRRNCYEPWLVKFRVVQLQIMETQKQMLFFAQLTIITFSSGLWSFSCTSEAITTFRNKLISWLLLVAIVLQLSDYFMKKQIIHKSFHAGLMIINWSSTKLKFKHSLDLHLIYENKHCPDTWSRIWKIDDSIRELQWRST